MEVGDENAMPFVEDFLGWSFALRRKGLGWAQGLVNRFGVCISACDLKESGSVVRVRGIEAGGMVFNNTPRTNSGTPCASHFMQACSPKFSA